jgi:TPR repeat protein
MRSKRSKAEDLFVRATETWDRGELRSAFRLMLAAAKGGDTGAQVNLGYFYDLGIGVHRNRAAALYWYRRAYRRGEMEGASNIGTIYRDEENLKHALAWFRRATAMGDGDANLEIAKIYLTLNNTQKALNHLKKVLKARYVTPASKEEARLLLKGNR